MRKITVKDINSFLDFLNTEIDRNDYRHKYLTLILDKVFGNGSVTITQNSLILNSDDKWLIYIETNGQLFMYGDAHEEFIYELSQIVPFNFCAGFEIMGEYNIVYKLLESSNITNFSVIKNRIFYSLGNTDKLLPTLDNPQAKIDDVNEITEMLLEYYKEEYLGTRNKTYDQVESEIEEHISENSIQIFRLNNVIQAFCTILDPDIGIIYVKPEFRDQKIGRRLLSSCCRFLYDKNKACYLMTDSENQASNKMIQGLGFKEIYRHANIKL